MSRLRNKSTTKCNETITPSYINGVVVRHCTEESRRQRAWEQKEEVLENWFSFNLHNHVISSFFHDSCGRFQFQFRLGAFTFNPLSRWQIFDINPLGGVIGPGSHAFAHHRSQWSISRKSHKSLFTWLTQAWLWIIHFTLWARHWIRSIQYKNGRIAIYHFCACPLPVLQVHNILTMAR